MNLNRNRINFAYMDNPMFYDSGLSIWLSVDPMSDKYPSMSPYNYCANNPVMLVDPDGRDVYTFDENGDILSHDDKQKGFDQVIIQKADGSTVEGEKYEYGTIKEVKEVTIHKGTEDEKTCTVIDINKDFDSKISEIFEFISKNSNVERGTLKAVGFPNFYRGLIGTSRDLASLYSQTEGYTSHIVNQLYGGAISILEWYHSHPYGTIGTPSGYDPSGFPLAKDDNAAAVRFLNIPDMRVYDVKENQYYMFNAATFKKMTKLKT